MKDFFCSTSLLSVYTTLLCYMLGDVHGNGIPNGTENPMGMRIKHRIGNGNGREWETTSVGKGITCTPMGIFSQRFYAGLKLVSAGSGECRDTNVDLGNKTKSNGHR